MSLYTIFAILGVQVILGLVGDPKSLLAAIILYGLFLVMDVVYWYIWTRQNKRDYIWRNIMQYTQKVKEHSASK